MRGESGMSHSGDQPLDKNKRASRADPDLAQSWLVVTLVPGLPCPLTCPSWVRSPDLIPESDPTHALPHFLPQGPAHSSLVILSLSS